MQSSRGAESEESSPCVWSLKNDRYLELLTGRRQFKKKKSSERHSLPSELIYKAMKASL